MSARQKELEARVASLRSELELSAFLNKGVLQTNSELKLRIVELEQENAALRTAESRLARTEDKLEAAERRLEKREREWEIAQAQWEEGLQRESDLREGLETERDEIRDEMEKWRFAWEGARKAMASLDAMDKAEKSEKTSARTTPTMPRTQASRNSMSGMASAGRRVTPSANSSARAGPSSIKRSVPKDDSPEPVRSRRNDRVINDSSSPIRPSRGSSRKRRVQDSADEAEAEAEAEADAQFDANADGPEDRTPQPSPPYRPVATPPRTRPRAAATAASAALTASARREAHAHAQAHSHVHSHAHVPPLAKRRDLKHWTPPAFEVKIEPYSPMKPRSVAGSDDDPLAMY